MRTELGLLCAAVLVAVPSTSDASACIPAFDYAAFGKNQLTFGGGAKTDSYNSANGSYASTRAATGGDVGTNGAGCGAITLNGSPTAVGGDASYGPGGTSCAVSGAGSISGTQSALPAAVSLPSVTIPAVGTSQGNQTIGSHGTLTLGANATYGSVGATGGSHLVFDAGVYVMSSLSLAGNSDMRVNSGPVVIYLSCTGPSASVGLDLTGGTVLNASLKATDLVFMVGPACSSVKVAGGTSAAFAVYAPDADVTLTGGGDIYGAVVGKTVTNTGGSAIHHDDALDTLAIGDFTCAANEVSRATPIAATVSGQSALVQGTYEPRSATRPAITTPADVASFTFPFWTGHLRARTTASVTTAASGYAAGTVLFDAGAAGKVPAVNNTGCSTFNGTCRNVFTTTQMPGTDGVSLRPSRVPFRDSNASTIGALIAPTSAVPGITSAHWQTIVRTVLAGRLGGIDRSTAAVIGPSVAAGHAARPTIAYVGSTDGMLHAVCASVGGTTESQANVCPSLGTELWAFMPRVQLSLVRSNTTRIDGSARVVDAFGDFTGSGTRSFRTILTLQTGSAPGAVYALDVTDPADPVVVWEYVAPTSTTFELGVGLALAVGPTLVGNTQKHVVVAATNNGGSGGAGVVVTALSLETGATAWQFGHIYPTPPRGLSGDPSVPATGIPGGATAVDLAAQGTTTDIVVGDLYGSLWRLDATTGVSRTGTTTPLFRFSSNRHPIGALPAIYSDGARQLAVFGSGGYADPVAATWRASSQSLIAVPITATGPYPLYESSPKLALNQSLASGTGVFAQVLVVGGELFVVGDSSDVNASTFGTTGDTGSVMRVNTSTGATTTVVVRGGAGSLARSSTTLFASSSDRQQQLGAGAASTSGPTVDTLGVPRLARLLWLRVNE